jgi:hypothetical protein
VDSPSFLYFYSRGRRYKQIREPRSFDAGTFDFPWLLPMPSAEPRDITEVFNCICYSYKQQLNTPLISGFDFKAVLTLVKVKFALI